MRYIIGIDLGTTNCCVAYVDTQNPKLPIQQFRVPQVIDIGYVDALPTLPSFCYTTARQEFPAGSLNLPWESQTDYVVGTLAQNHGSRVPTRLVQSAKSWLCHSGADRRDKILADRFPGRSEVAALQGVLRPLLFRQAARARSRHLPLERRPDRRRRAGARLFHDGRRAAATEGVWHVAVGRAVVAGAPAAAGLPGGVARSLSTTPRFWSASKMHMASFIVTSFCACDCATSGMLKLLLLVINTFY